MSSDVLDTIIGKVCLERGWVERSQFFDCLRECGLSSDTPTNSTPLVEILISKGFVSRPQMDQLRKEVSSYLNTGRDYAAAQKEDAMLRHILRTEGHVSKEHLDRAIDVQRDTAARGAPASGKGSLGSTSSRSSSSASRPRSKSKALPPGR